MKRLNWRIILSNLGEAREQLEDIERRAKRNSRLSEEELRIFLQHVYHHLNFAWNVRRVATARYAKMTDREFLQWGKYPAGIEKV
jgi:hypothetical protein